MPPVLQYRDMSTSHISTSGFSAVLVAMVAVAQVAAADIQSRIDACHAAGGGVVRVAAGRYENMVRQAKLGRADRMKGSCTATKTTCR